MSKFVIRSPCSDCPFREPVTKMCLLWECPKPYWVDLSSPSFKSLEEQHENHTRYSK